MKDAETTNRMDINKLVKEIKHRFMELRNGIVADTLRSGGITYKVIFGLQLPQLSEMARELRQRLEESDAALLASELWQESNVRESRLLACRLLSHYPAEAAKHLTAMASEIKTREEADILIFSLLRHYPEGKDLIADIDVMQNESLLPYLRQVVDRNL